MKKTLLIFACALVFGSGAGAQTARKVDFAMKIAEATPPSLPQLPPEKRVSTDARDQGLKGKIKRLVLTGVDPGNVEPVPYLDEDFNEMGNLTKAVGYHEGFPLTVTVWGFVDRQRVSRSKDVIYAPGERLSSKTRVITANSRGTPIDPKAPNDTRYQTRSVRKYDQQKRLIETQTYYNNGAFRSRTTYTYNGNRRDLRWFSDRNRDISPNVRRLYTGEILDKQGDVTAEEIYDDHGRVVERRVFTHQFDSHGNWIIRNTLKEETIEGKKVQKLGRTLYRTITYYL